LTDPAIWGIPTKRLQANIDTQNARLEYQHEEAAREAKYDQLVREVTTWTFGRRSGRFGTKGLSGAASKADWSRGLLKTLGAKFAGLFPG
jgi:hypothetical protein